MANGLPVSDTGHPPSTRTDSGLDLHTICCPQICLPAFSADEPSTDDKSLHLLLSRRLQYDHSLLTLNKDDTAELA